MLDVDYKQQKNGLPPPLQECSDTLVFALSKMRDTKAPIPAWAKNYPIKQRAYLRYRSPNVFFEFSPHFTIMAKKFEDKETAQAFHDEVQYLIAQYRQQYPDNQKTIKSTQFGIGYVNQYGQITSEITGFSLQK